MINGSLLNGRDIIVIGAMSLVFSLLVDRIFASVVIPPSKQPE